eukprot:371214_1
MDTATETFQLSPDRLVYHAACVDAIVVDGVLYAFGGRVGKVDGFSTEFTDTFMYYVLPTPTTNLPAETPTKRPTPMPTAEPTCKHTSNPTQISTAKPTPKPTSKPTPNP